MNPDVVPAREPPTASVWPARRSAGGDAAPGAAGALGVVAAIALGLGLGQEPGWGTVMLLVAASAVGASALALLAWSFGYRRLRYTVAADALEVNWLGRTVRLPLAAINGVYPGQRLVGAATPRTPSWPGIFVGIGRVRGVGRLRFFSTSRDPADLTLVTFPTGGLVLSSREPQSFRTALIEAARRHENAPVPVGPPQYERPRGVPWTALWDRWVLPPVGVGLVLVLTGVAIVAGRYATLPERLPLRFDELGQPSLIGSRGDLLHLPLLGAALLVLNAVLAVGLHAREPMLARLLSVAGAVLQVLVVVAMVRLVQ